MNEPKNHQMSEELALNGEYINDIWTPDIYFPSCKKGKLQDITKINSLVRIRRNGSIYMSQRYISCN